MIFLTYALGLLVFAGLIGAVTHLFKD
ncbi:potassium-transporting ATPase subunit B [Fulvimarina pelagi HTCC2506]|uniref:Potassium-transporting ATPase subunit B n=1 Tax=Fulvimarina pelagi HTCC2506 TaxID=314231 RepID=Q0G2W4_9HYPH|nr:potassium-transporting ATPase subunit B [Fulvimarina pelagi HTCC2506]